MLVSVQIKQYGKTQKSFTIVSCCETDTLQTIFNTHYEGNESGTLQVKSFVGKSDGIKPQEIILSANVKECADNFGRYITFEVCQDQEKTQATENINPFQRMMSARYDTYLPPKHKKETSNKLKLFNKILQHLDDRKLGFPKSVDSKAAKNTIWTITNVIWYIDPHISKFTSRGCIVPEDIKPLLGYNDQAKSKHKVPSIDGSILYDHGQDLERVLLLPLMRTPDWLHFADILQQLSDSIFKYCKYLTEKAKEVQHNRESINPVRNPQDNAHMQHITPDPTLRPHQRMNFNDLNSALLDADLYFPVSIEDFTKRMTTRERRTFIDKIPSGVTTDCTLYRVAYGNNLGTLNFIWRRDPNASNESDHKTIQSIDLPVFHTRAMRSFFMQKCSLITKDTKKSILRSIYRQLTGDTSTGETDLQNEIDRRVDEAFDTEDVDLILDQRKYNQRPRCFDEFLEKTKLYLENVVETAVDERRHGEVPHMAAAMSVTDLHSQVVKTCPDEMLIPSVQWLYWQFYPRNPAYNSAKRHTGLLNVHFGVQSRQLRSEHIDSHYAACAFHYLRHLAIKFKDFTTFLCEDDKHHVKVGEPGTPVAAVERGKRIITTNGVRLSVCDHDFTKFSIIPSVIMMLDIPDTIEESFYRGQVFVGVRDLVQESSSPLRHGTELVQVLSREENNKPILLLYTDGGPDHRCTYLSVQLVMFCIFYKMDLDMLILMRTPPRGSWRNPPERIMSTLNIALQCVGLERKKMSEACEKKIKSSTSLQSLRDIAEHDINMRIAMSDTLQPVKVLLNGLFSRLTLKGKNFKTFEACSQEDMKELWSVLDTIDDNVPIEKQDQKSLQKVLQDREILTEYIAHCSTTRHYHFTLKKCGEDPCPLGLCQKPRVPSDVFADVFPVPDPQPGEDGHYKQFDEVYGTRTTEEFRPSKLTENKGHRIPFPPSLRTASNTAQCVICSECDRPRCLHSKLKLLERERQLLQRILENYSYSCGAVFQDVIGQFSDECDNLIQKVYTRAHISCDELIETPYYKSHCFPPVCVHCGTGEELNLEDEDVFPYCVQCSSKPLKNFRKKAKV